MFDSDLEVDVLALQSLSSPSELGSEVEGLGGGATCCFTLVCGVLTVNVTCCQTINCHNTVCVVTKL
jgi:hypothetical protein